MSKSEDKEIDLQWPWYTLL